MTIRLTSVKPIPIAYPDANDDGRLRYLCLVEVESNDGAVGWGEAVTLYPEACRATATVIDGIASSVLLGRDCSSVVARWHDMKRHVWWYGEGGIASLAIAALDIALWDLAGKAAGLSVTQLLGGPVHERLPAMATGHAVHADIADQVDDISAWLATGLTAVKVGFGKKGHARLGYSHDRDIEFVAALRTRLGPDKGIMIDVGNSINWDTATAVRRTRAMEDYDIDWIEEPLGHDNPDGYETLRAKTTTRIAYGEREWGPSGIRRIVRTGTVDVIGVDPGRAEGITGFHHAAEIIEAAQRQINAHSYSSAVVAAASLAASMATPAAKVLEIKAIRDPVQTELVRNPVTPSDGYWLPAAAPGLGIEVIPEVVQRFSLRQGDLAPIKMS